MNWASALLVYVVIWWIVFFIALPFGVRPPDEAGEEVLPGNATSAPARPRLWLKVGITTLVSAALWGVAYFMIVTDAISFR
jgi:predicted secreted protein